MLGDVLKSEGLKLKPFYSSVLGITWQQGSVSSMSETNTHIIQPLLWQSITEVQWWGFFVFKRVLKHLHIVSDCVEEVGLL